MLALLRHSPSIIPRKPLLINFHPDRHRILLPQIKIQAKRKSRQHPNPKIPHIRESAAHLTGKIAQVSIINDFQHFEEHHKAAAG